jgi:glycosyltransferase involved in cell wall biosynthesis
MKILLFHPRLLPPKDYGGVERVVLWLARGLVERGHEVHVAAWRGSRLPPGARLVELGPEDLTEDEILARFPEGLDIVHFMAPTAGRLWARAPGAKLLTVHGNAKPGERYPRDTVFLSEDHARRHHATCFVHNGIDPAEVRFDPDGKRAELLFLSKTSWGVKNLAGAMRICRIAGVPLRIAGGHRPWGLRARAWLTPGQAWVGPVAGERKAELLSQARALVFPVRWPEPFGLVVVEALMSGTPVIASRLGSLPELVGPEVGMLLDPPLAEDGSPESKAAWQNAWVSALSESAELARARWSPEACREWAMSRFHYSRMAEGYESVYLKVSKQQQPLNDTEPGAPL